MLMDKRLKQHDEFIKSEIENLTDELAKKRNPDDVNSRACSLLNYHNNVIKYFQHERLIHLLVTFFFAVLLITSLIIMFIPNDFEYYYIDNFLLIISAILLVVEVFYVRYYYYLENGTQKLYKYSKVLFEFIQKTS